VSSRLWTKAAMVVATVAGATGVIGPLGPDPAPTAAQAVTTTGVFVPIEPCRIADTRPAGDRLEGEVRSFRIAGATDPDGTFAAQGGRHGGCGIPDGANAVKVSITAVDPGGSGYLRVWPAGTAAPNASFLNYLGDSVTNAGAVAIAGDPSTDDLSVRAFAGDTDLVIDVQGFYVTSDAIASGSTFVPITPCRIVDTRNGGGPLDASALRTWQVAGSGAGFAGQGGRTGGCGIPADALAVEATITATAPERAGFLRAWPATSSAPLATFLNYPARHSTTNTGAIAIAVDPSAADLTLRALNGRTHVVIDVQGYYAPVGTGTSFTPVSPCRIVDTRRGGGRVPGNANRTFRVTGNGDFAAQGGYPGGCGIPDSAAAVEATVSVVSPLGSGYLRTWPGDRSEPNATVVNFRRGANLTNTGATTIATSAGTADLTVGARGAATYVVIDIQGWYSSTAFATDVTSGAGHSCALMSSATARCWGSNIDGELGDGSTTSRATAAPVALTSVAQISAGADHTCARRLDTTVACWGANSSGQLGDGTTTSASLPTTVPALTAVTSISAGLLFTCATRTDGTVVCWGANDAGQLGIASDAVPSPVPVTVPGIDDAVAVTTGHQHACAIRSDGTVRCWGDDSSGQLGDGPTDSTAGGPVAVTALTGVTSIGAAYRHTCAVADGAVRCWGSNANGRLGTGSTTSSNVPMTASGISTAVEVSVGGGHSCAALTDGGIRCWGLNASGQLGDGTTTARLTPTAAAGAPSAGAVDAGSDHTCARIANGSVRCWGYNTTGQVGDGTTDNRTTPVAVQGI
jgi:alpha-tubulin suppressor-like RCC1 family protein